MYISGGISPYSTWKIQSTFAYTFFLHFTRKTLNLHWHSPKANWRDNCDVYANRNSQSEPEPTFHAIWDAGNDYIVTPTRDPHDGPWQLSHGFEVMSSASIASKICPESLIQTDSDFSGGVLRSNCFTAELRQLFDSLYKISLSFHESNITYVDILKNCLFVVKRLEHLELRIDMLEIQPAFTELLSNL
jgi:hypothetical protein